ncbi:MAG: hypothetical protein COA97_04590 [Flavobacteriales bacterium]|nr:MAG: hypothetical protein COA97_04590 [Flavobacteriales bacterium]
MKNISLILVLLLSILSAKAQINSEDNLLAYNDAVGVDNFINVSLYPNPNKGYFYIKMKNNKPFDVTIYAMNGMIIYSKKNIQENTYRINLESSISKGFYQVVFRQGKNAIVKKLIIN